MRSKLAEELRREQMEDVLRMTPAERVERMRAVRELAIELYMANAGVDRETAVRAIRRERQAGRRYSRCMTESLK